MDENSARTELDFRELKSILTWLDHATVGVASSPPDKPNGGQGVSFLAHFKKALWETGVLF